MKAVILAGGLGTRLQPYTTFLPKPMLPLGEKPLLEHLIEWSRKNGIKSIVLCTSYLKKSIEDYFEDGRRFGVEIEYASSDRPMSTAGQLKTAEDLVDGTFACMYGDSIYRHSLRGMIKQHRQKKSFVTMGLYEYGTRLPYGVIKTARGGRVTAWDEKPEIKVQINMGCYIMESGIFSLIPKNRTAGMDGIIHKAISSKRKVDGYLTSHGFVDIGDVESYKKASEQYLEKLGRI